MFSESQFGVLMEIPPPGNELFTIRLRLVQETIHHLDFNY
jgi:hypothetical protein